MTTAVDGTQSSQNAYGLNSTAQASSSTIDSDTFLQLLVAQLKYQDPSNPMDGTAMLGQTAQFQMVQNLQQLAAQNLQMLSEQQASSAISLVGRNISYTDSKGDTQTGLVDSVRLSSTGPVLTIGDTDVPLSSVTEIRAAG